MCVEMIDLIKNESLNGLSPPTVIMSMLAFIGTYVS